MSRTALVVTVVHHPEDARIRHRQIPALLDAGWQVRYAAPFSDYGIDPGSDTQPVAQSATRAGLTMIDLPRARGRRRIGPVRAARALISQQRGEVDVVLLHDPDLLIAAAARRRSGAPLVWDVHEDTAAAVQVRSWVPGLLRSPLASGVRLAERWAESRIPLLLADQQYAQRFRREHPVVPNTTRVPEQAAPAAVPEPDGRYRLVYLGSVTLERGATEMVELAERVADLAVLDIIGPAHGAAQQILSDAHQAGTVRWHGQVPNDRALEMVDGALAGLSLLHDIANFRPSMATKVVEYLARGVPAVTSALPVPAELVQRGGGGVVVPFTTTTGTGIGAGPDLDAVEAAVRELAADPDRARAMGVAGHAVVKADYDWAAVAPDFVAHLERIAADGG